FFLYVLSHAILLFISYFLRECRLNYFPSFPTRRSSDLCMACSLTIINKTEKAGLAIPAKLHIIERKRPGSRRQLKCCGRKQYVEDRKSTRLNSSRVSISYAVFCLLKKKTVTNAVLHVSN